MPMATDDPVRRALDTVAEADALRHAPPHLERAVLDALDRHLDRGYLRRWVIAARPYQYAAAAIVLGLVVAATIYSGVVSDVFKRPLTPARGSQAPAVEHQSARVDPDTVLASEDGDIAQRVRVRVPRSMLPMLGVPIINPDAPGTVNLEVILREDGLARTIRIVP